MTPLRRLTLTVAPFLVSGACAQLIGLSEYEKGEVTGSAGENNEGGEGGRDSGGGSGGSSGNQSGGSGGRGGSRTGGDGGMAGDPQGGDAGEGGVGGDPSGGQGGGPPRGGSDGGGMGGASGSGGGGAGGTAGGTNCTTVPVPIVSADFDGDNSAWVPYSEGSAIPINVTAESLGISADTEPNVAHLGGVDNVYSGQFQRITIPQGAVTMTLTGYRYIVSSEDPMSENVYDDMAIQMWVDALDPTAGRVGEFIYYTHMNPTNGWTMFMGTAAVSAHAGQAVDLDMWGYTDDSIITHFYIDSLALTALVCK